MLFRLYVFFIAGLLHILAAAMSEQERNPSPVPTEEPKEFTCADKTVRLLTVMTYVFSISGMSLALATFYIFIWKPEGADYYP